MEIKEIDDKTLDNFVYKSDKAHFMQTSGFKDVAKTRGYITHALGLYENDILKASAVMLEKKIGPFSTFYCPRGFICDYKDKELLKGVIDALKAYTKKHHGLYFKINPDLIIAKLDENAKRIETYKTIDLISFFKENGAQFRGFTTKFTESSAPRFTFRIDLKQDEKTLFNNLHNTTKKILKENNPYEVIITKNEEGALDDFYKIMKETSKRKKMFVESYSYFKNFYEKLYHKKEADIYVASINTKRLKEILDDKIASVNKEIDNTNKRPDGPKKNNKLNDLDKKYHKILKLKNEVDNIKEERVALSSIITAKFKDKVWTVHGGSSDQLLFLNANYELYYHIILDSKKQGYDIVDFYGSEGKVDKDSPIYGIYLFKLRFGGDFIEFIGEFDFITRPILYIIITTLLKIRRRILYQISLKGNRR